MRKFCSINKNSVNCGARLLEKPRQFYERLARELATAGTADLRSRALLANGHRSSEQSSTTWVAFATHKLNIKRAPISSSTLPESGPRNPRIESVWQAATTS